MKRPRSVGRIVICNCIRGYPPSSSNIFVNFFVGKVIAVPRHFGNIRSVLLILNLKTQEIHRG